MADKEVINHNQTTLSRHHHHHHRTSNLGWSTKRSFMGRRRKVATVRLGGEKKIRRGRGIVMIMKVLRRRIRLRWLKLQYSFMLKKLKETYYSMVKELVAAGATLDTIQQRIMSQPSYFSVPVMGAPSSGISSSALPRPTKRLSLTN